MIGSVHGYVPDAHVLCQMRRLPGLVSSDLNLRKKAPSAGRQRRTRACSTDVAVGDLLCMGNIKVLG
jgi:hypothetical protein